MYFGSAPASTCLPLHVEGKSCCGGLTTASRWFPVVIITVCMTDFSIMRGWHVFWITWVYTVGLDFYIGIVNNREQCVCIHRLAVTAISLQLHVTEYCCKMNANNCLMWLDGEIIRRPLSLIKMWHFISKQLISGFPERERETENKRLLRERTERNKPWSILKTTGDRYKV